MRVIGITDESRRYRWWLERVWDEARPQATFISINPRSEGQHLDNDRTTQRCVRQAKQSGCGRIVLVNLFARRSDVAIDIRADGDPVGAECDDYLDRAIQEAALVVVAWGNLPEWAQPRARQVLERIPAPMCLGVTQRGFPRHPSRAPRTELVPYLSP